MKIHRLALVLLFLALPAVLHARAVKDRVILRTQSVGAVEFGHSSHLQAVGRNCPTCHNGVFHLIPAKNPTFTMKEMEQGKSCGACHNGQRAFSVKENCATCHAGDVTIANEGGETLFSHEVHLGMYGCSECHPALFAPEKGKNPAAMEQMERGKSCGACHDGATAFTVKENCELCHKM